MAQIYRMSEDARVRAREYSKHYRSSKGRASRFQFELPGDRDVKESVLAKMRRVAELQGEAGLNSTQVLNTVLDYWLQQHRGDGDDVPQGQVHHSKGQGVSSYVPCARTSVDQQMFVTTDS